MKEIIVEVNSLTKKYGEQLAVDSVSFQIEKGEIFGFIGPNGAGKTTTLLMLTGLVEPTSGSIKICSLDLKEHILEIKRRIGFLPEKVQLYPNLTAIQNVEFIAKLNGIKNRSRYEEALEKVGLKEAINKKVGAFSKGMMQRLGIACILVKHPDVIFLDEPNSGLDPTGTKELRELMLNLKSEGITIFFSSHILPEVNAMCDKVGIIHSGRLLAVDSIPNLAMSISRKLYREEVQKEVSLERIFIELTQGRVV